MGHGVLYLRHPQSYTLKTIIILYMDHHEILIKKIVEFNVRTRHSVTKKKIILQTKKLRYVIIHFDVPQIYIFISYIHTFIITLE